MWPISELQIYNTRNHFVCVSTSACARSCRPPDSYPCACLASLPGQAGCRYACHESFAFSRPCAAPPQLLMVKFYTATDMVGWQACQLVFWGLTGLSYGSIQAACHQRLRGFPMGKGVEVSEADWGRSGVPLPGRWFGGSLTLWFIATGC